MPQGFHDDLNETLPLVYVKNRTETKIDQGSPAFIKSVNSAGGVLECDYTLEYVLYAMIGVLTYWFQSTKPMRKDELLALMYRLTYKGGGD